MVQLITQRVRISREGRQWLRGRNVRVRPFKAALAAFMQMDARWIGVRVRHKWVEEIAGRFDAGAPAPFRCGAPVVIDYGLLAATAPASAVWGPDLSRRGGNGAPA